ncbi:MAG: phosphoglucosamine mutase, partial [bacterium]|nr:phosphoglucosamine mutase [bacterium]
EMETGRAAPENLGKAFRIDDADGRYTQFLKNCFPRERTLEGLKIVVDCSNGAGYVVAPNVLGELGAHVYPIANRPDGTNINRNCGSLHTESLCRHVKEIDADCGIALDGDADRVILCDEKGHVVDGDVIMALCALHWKKRKTLKKETLVTTVMSNLALDHAMEKNGIRLVKTQVGDRYVVEEMRKNGCNMGGEQSGHLIFLDYNTTGDGILGALMVLKIMLEEQKPLSELRRVLIPYPQILINVPVREKKDFASVPKVLGAIHEVEKTLGKEGRILVRYSGTENIARVMVEGEDSKKIHHLAGMVEEVIKEHLAK